jgi:3-dehydroquinate synthase
VERALQVKVQIVERDPFEDNLRAHLNLGHTFGQAVERLAKYRMRHGYAVAMGLATAARLAVHLEYCAPTVCNEILGLLEQYQLPTRLPHEFTPAQILDAMGTDKKIQNKKLRLVLPRAIGHVEIAENVAPEEILRALNESY